jgi:hypothetical protein
VDPIGQLAQARDYWLIFLTIVFAVMWRLHDRELSNLEAWLREYPNFQQDYKAWLKRRAEKRAELQRSLSDRYASQILGTCDCDKPTPDEFDRRCKECRMVIKK